MEWQALGTASTFGSVNIGFEFNVRVTIARLRGNAFVRMVPDAASSSMILGLGLIVVDKEAFTAGIASVPSPVTDPEASWLWHQLYPLGPAVGTEVVNELGTVWQTPIDSKAQRKVRVDEVLAIVAEGLITAGTPTCDGAAAVRLMTLLS